jgi:hypothetical protein
MKRPGAMARPGVTVIEIEAAPAARSSGVSRGAAPTAVDCGRLDVEMRIADFPQYDSAF